jgi:hypothetical protein
VLALIDVATFDEARRFINTSPFRHGDFERVEVAEYDVEIGRLGQAGRPQATCPPNKGGPAAAGLAIPVAGCSDARCCVSPA